MTSRSRLVRAAVAAALAGTLLGPLTGADAAPARGGDDAVVVAVIDGSFSPYHWDFAASKMPQHLNRDRSDDIPLSQAPHTYLPGFPKPSAFKGGYRPLKLSLAPNDEDAVPAELDAQDADQWETFEKSTKSAVDYRWIPNSKIIGALSFGGSQAPGKRFHAATNAHGMGTSSVSVGNIYGTCGECLVVKIQYSDAASGEEAIQWAQSQPWIDVITNSYGFSRVERERVYNGSNTTSQVNATVRGQMNLFSSGNGISNTFTIPNSTLTSSQEGPDWIVTVGAVDETDDDNYTGTGKPADIAGMGGGYPSAYTAKNQTGGGKFGGTSNATPMIAGTYARALYFARRAMAGPSRAQSAGVISVGKARCGKVRPTCEIGDGRLTEPELRARLFRGAIPTDGSIDPLSQGITSGPAVADQRFLSEGHGVYHGRIASDTAVWEKEFRGRLLNPLLGTAAEAKRPAGEVEYMRVDSWCRQHIWGEWGGGYFTGSRTPLPADSPAYPARTSYRNACENMQAPPA